MAIKLQENMEEKRHMSKFADEIEYIIRPAETEDFEKVSREFNSGNDEIDKDFANSEYERRFVSYVAINKDNNDIIAIYSLACSSCVYLINEKSYFSPSIEIVLFAVDERYQNLKTQDDSECLSNIIFYELLSYISDLTDNVIGALKVILYATPNAVEFYSKCGFGIFENNMIQKMDRFLDGCTAMYADID